MAQLFKMPTQRADNIQNTGETVEPMPAPGWDPYEVWRTRVLLPRLKGDEQPAASSTAQSSSSEQSSSAEQHSPGDDEDPAAALLGSHLG